MFFWFYPNLKAPNERADSNLDQSVLSLVLSVDQARCSGVLFDAATLLAGSRSKQFAIEQHMRGDAGGVAQRDYGCPLEVREKGVSAARLSHQRHASRRADG